MPNRNIPDYTNNTHSVEVRSVVSRKSQRLYETAVTRNEYQILLRMRELLNSGADLLIIDKRNGKPWIRPVGK